LPGGDFYGFQASAANYYPLSQNLDLRKLNEYQEKGIDLFLFPLKVGQKVKLNNVFFDTGKFSFRKETYVELDRLVLFLKQNTTTVIRIDGHTDNQGEDATNMVLSNNRAKAVYDYLILKGVQAIQLSFKGFGETAPVDVNTTETGRQNNRRVEFLIEKI
jgi:outer membrane protein OmpA-like peptidoglycan-associated protein